MVDSPFAYTVTSTPSACNPRARSAINNSVPPYSLGGTGMKGDATKATRIRSHSTIRCHWLLNAVHGCAHRGSDGKQPHDSGSIHKRTRQEVVCRFQAARAQPKYAERSISPCGSPRRILNGAETWPSSPASRGNAKANGRVESSTGVRHGKQGACKPVHRCS